MGENQEEYKTIFSQDGVLLKNARSFYIHYINQIGTLYINEYVSGKFIEWKPNTEVTIEAETQDQEWALVSTIERNRSPNNLHSELRLKYIKIKIMDIKAFSFSRKMDRLCFMDGSGDIICNFIFHHGSCNSLMAALKGLVKVMPARRDAHHLYVLEELNRDALTKSFADLNLFEDNNTQYYPIWNFVKSLPRQYEATKEAFSKITSIGIASPQDEIDEDTSRSLQESITAVENVAQAHAQDEYEVIAPTPVLPERKDYPRGNPLNEDQWNNLQDQDGVVENVEFTKLHIFHGGVTPVLRKTLWKYLLDYHPWNSTRKERQEINRNKREEYYVMKLQWKSMTKIQENNFNDFYQRKSLIEKDVNRTDRNLEFYAGDNNPNLQILNDVLMTYLMYNFDIGYVQGMSDLLSPILYVLKNEVDAFWCFVGFMNRIGTNFEYDQIELKEQLEKLYTLVGFLDQPLANHLKCHESANMFFCFRWILVWYKRELGQDDVLRLWEILWTGLPCQNFHLLISVAILLNERNALIRNACGFTEILRYVNDLYGKLDIASILNKAEGIYNQIIEAEHLTDSVRIIIGLPLTGNSIPDGLPNYDSSNDISNSVENVTAADIADLCDAGLNNFY